jgi:hypothetical protein
MFLPCPLHILLPRYPRVLGAGLHLSQLSHFRGPPHRGRCWLRRYYDDLRRNRRLSFACRGDRVCDRARLCCHLRPHGAELLGASERRSGIASILLLSWLSWTPKKPNPNTMIVAMSPTAPASIVKLWRSPSSAPFSSPSRLSTDERHPSSIPGSWGPAPPNARGGGVGFPGKSGITWGEGFSGCPISDIPNCPLGEYKKFWCGFWVYA